MNINNDIKMNFRSAIILGVCLLINQFQASGTIKLPKMFSDNMVLKQQSEVPLWGTASPCKEIVIKTSWDRNDYKVVSDQQGKWAAKIQTSKAGGPYSISISDGQVTELHNILLGEVWICSGQSNMEMPIKGWGWVKNAEHEVMQANHPQIRLFQVEKDLSDSPLNDLKSSNIGWVDCSSNTVADFSAVAYFFGRELNKQLNVPIGLINASWGGTPAEAWTSADALIQMPFFKDEVMGIKTLTESEQVQAFEKKYANWEEMVSNLDFGYQGKEAVVSGTTYNDQDWKKMDIPTSWEDCGLPDYDGIIWFRKVIQIPEDWNSKELVLSLGKIDDTDITFFNGIKIGTTDGYYVNRTYVIPDSLVKQGKAVITVRVTDTGGGGGFVGGHDEMWLANKENEQAKMPIDGSWGYKCAINLNKIPIAPRNPTNNQNKPTVLYNAMIHPFRLLPMSGFIWYQGESNADRDYQAIQYRDLFPLLIRDWRSVWKGNLPFYYVQLANYKAQRSVPQESNWALLREAQLNTLRLANTGMAVTIDIGEAYDIHPKNKQEVGKRLALQALSNTYNMRMIASGPIYDSYTIGNGKIRIKFKQEKSELKTTDNQRLKGFSIAGVDHIFHWAEAYIVDEEVVVFCPEVRFPVAVRYAWADNPVCNLTNNSGIPASPFRTDDW